MIGVRIQYIRLEIRKLFSYMKHRLMGLCGLFLLLAIILGVCYLRIAGQEERSLVHVAFVIPGEQEELMQVAKLLQHMDSVRGTMAFVYPEADEVDALFESGEIQAAILFNQDFYEDVNSGVNTPVQIRLDQQYPGTELFQELLTNVVSIIDVTEAASYAMIDCYHEQKPDMSLSEMEDLILEDNVELMFHTRNQIEVQIVSPTGEVDLLQFYISIMFFLYLLLPGLSFWSLYDPGNRLAEEKLKVYGVGRLYRCVCKIVLMALVIFLYSLVALGICCLFGDYAGFYVTGYESDTLWELVVFSVMLACFYHSILLLSGERGERRKIIVLTGAILLLVGGCLIPCAYLPIWAEKIAPWTPFYIYRSYLESVLFGGAVSYVGMSVWALIFLGIGEGYYTVTGFRVSDSCEYADAKKNFKRALSAGTIRQQLFRGGMYLKWQWKRKSPVIIIACVLLLIGLCANIHFPIRQNRTVYISGEENLCLEMEDDPRLNQTFDFVYEADESARMKAVEGGQVLAGVVFSGEKIQIETNALTPEVLIARETIAVAYYQYAQKQLLKSECEKVFGTDTIYGEVYDAFDQYIHNEKLFHVEYQMEPKDEEETK